jgi:hypothetical protein
VAIGTQKGAFLKEKPHSFMRNGVLPLCLAQQRFFGQNDRIQRPPDTSGGSRERKKCGFLFLGQRLEFYGNPFRLQPHNLPDHLGGFIAVWSRESQHEALSRGKTETGWDKHASKAYILDVPAVRSASTGIVNRQVQVFSVVPSAALAFQQAVFKKSQERAPLVI